MSIGRGWFPDEPRNEHEAMAQTLLKQVLQEVFEKIASNKNGYVIRGKYYG